MSTDPGSLHQQLPITLYEETETITVEILQPSLYSLEQEQVVETGVYTPMS